MNIKAQFALLFGVCMAGTAISRMFPFPLPASVLSMIIMTCLFSAGIVRLESMEESSSLLLGNMALFFIPPGVGILAHIDSLKGDLLIILGICFAATIMTAVVTAFAVSLTMRLVGKFGAEKGGGAQ